MHQPPPHRHSRFRRSRILIVGCGDVGLRAAQRLLPRCRLLALTSSPERVAALRAAGITPLRGNLDDARSLARLAALAPRVLHLAPPPGQGVSDPRTARLLQALGQAGRLRTLVYGSTSGVYGDAQGAWVDETRAVAPATDRGRRRVDAERRVRAFGQRLALRQGGAATVLRIPGIYALDREGGDPRERVRKGSPVLQAADDVFTNHIHADDLARACVAALWRARPGRALNVCDDTELRMGDHFDLVADRFGLQRPPRLSRAEAALLLSPMQMSFMGESRRLHNRRMKDELGLVLRYPTVAEGLAQLLGAGVLAL
jgi:nucleoside-diphosphate-sugar epimerase